MRQTLIAVLNREYGQTGVLRANLEMYLTSGNTTRAPSAERRRAVASLAVFQRLAGQQPLHPYSSKKLVSREPIYDYLLAKGAEKQGQYIVYAGWPLQFLPADSSPLMAETLDRARRVAAGGVSVWIFTQEHLAAVALDVGRPQDKTRLNALVKSSTFNAEEFKAILHRHGLERKYEDWLKWQRNQ